MKIENNKLLILGAKPDGIGPTLIHLAKQNKFNIKGFLDDTPDLLNKKIDNYKVLDKIINIEKYKNYRFIIAVGDPKGREIVYRTIKKYKKNLINLIDEGASLSDNIKLGKGIIIKKKVIIEYKTIIEDNVYINNAAIINHNCIVGMNSHLAPGCLLCGRVKIGKNVLIGAGAVILPDIEIEDNCIIGAGSVVTKDIKKNKIVKGNPAR